MSDDVSEARALARARSVPKNMTRTVIAVVDDLFFASRIRGTAEQLGVRVVFVKTIDAVIDAAEREPPELIIADLQSQRCDPMGLAQRLKSNEGLRPILLIGFFSHVQTEVQRQAQEAGFDSVIPRSMFTKNLVEILAGH
jgi:CheY-like chemotaxis protein